MQVDPRVLRRCEVDDEDARLWQPGRGDLLRLRTWDIFARVLPPSGLVLDVGGGPGTHAAHLADEGYEVITVDPLLRHCRKAADEARTRPDTRLGVASAEARSLPVRDGAVDVVLVMGPLYHLIDHDERIAALQEARRCLHPGGVLVAEMITRHAWVLDASTKELLDKPGVWEQFDRNITTGLSLDPAQDIGDGFFAYFHAVDEFQREIAEAGFGDIDLTAVEGFGWLLGDLERRMTDPGALLRAIQLTEREPSVLGASAHVIATATKPNPPATTSLRPDHDPVVGHHDGPSRLVPVVVRTGRRPAQQEAQTAIEARAGDEGFSQSWGYHSRVSPEHQYVCMTVPKVGCTTIKRTLRTWEGLPALDDGRTVHQDEKHPRLAHFSSAETAAMLTTEDWTRFAFVRNPYDRLFSAWKSKITNTWDTQYLWLRDAIRHANDYPPSTDRFTPYVAFADYARYVATTDEPRVVLDGHLNLQTNVLLIDLIPYDVIGRFETFADDFAAILGRHGAPDYVIALAGEVTNPTPHLPLAAGYDRDLADIVYRKYEPDFEAFGYHRDSWLYT